MTFPVMYDKMFGVVTGQRKRKTKDVPEFYLLLDDGSVVRFKTTYRLCISSFYMLAHVEVEDGVVVAGSSTAITLVESEKELAAIRNKIANVFTLVGFTERTLVWEDYISNAVDNTKKSMVFKFKQLKRKKSYGVMVKVDNDKRASLLLLGTAAVLFNILFDGERRGRMLINQVVKSRLCKGGVKGKRYKGTLWRLDDGFELQDPLHQEPQVAQIIGHDQLEEKLRHEGQNGPKAEFAQAISTAVQTQPDFLKAAWGISPLDDHQWPTDGASERIEDTPECMEDVAECREVAVKPKDITSGPIRDDSAPNYNPKAPTCSSSELKRDQSGPTNAEVPVGDSFEPLKNALAAVVGCPGAAKSKACTCCTPLDQVQMLTKLKIDIAFDNIPISEELFHRLYELAGIDAIYYTNLVPQG